MQHIRNVSPFCFSGETCQFFNAWGTEKLLGHGLLGHNVEPLKVVAYSFKLLTVLVKSSIDLLHSPELSSSLIAVEQKIID